MKGLIVRLALISLSDVVHAPCPGHSYHIHNFNAILTSNDVLSILINLIREKRDEGTLRLIPVHLPAKS